jgi:hypothetical protein
LIGGPEARQGKADARFTDLRVAYLIHQYGLRPRYDRLRERGMLTKAEVTARLGISESTLKRWVNHGLVARQAYSGQAYLYEAPEPNLPAKQCRRWNRLTDRVAAINQTAKSKCSLSAEGGAV